MKNQQISFRSKSIHFKGSRELFGRLLLGASLWLAGWAGVHGQPLGEPDRGAPGDEMIQSYLATEAARLTERFQADLASKEAWEGNRARYREEYLYMLGLWPLPERTPLQATTTNTIERSDYVVEMLHYQSRPGLYVTGNLYRPARVEPGVKLPAVLYVCGHSGRGRNGNKVAFQSHGIWLARHGYVCLIVDTLQLGEIAAFHHGTYNLQRWSWHSRGYTPAGVEAWNGVRGIDYLVSRADVDPERIAVTGISGGGAATFWIAAADERVRVAMPVSGMADLESYVTSRVINGHCDCMFLYNTFQWPWTRIAGLIAPRPQLFVNSDQDDIFPMDANERVINRLERLYSLYGASDQVDAVVSVGGHAYRQDIRAATYRFLNTHLQNDPRAILDSEMDVVSEGGEPGVYPIEPEKLRVFPQDADLPSDARNRTIDESFVPLASPGRPTAENWESWRNRLRQELLRVSFPYFPERLPAAEPTRSSVELTLQTEAPITVRLRWLHDVRPTKEQPQVALVVLTSEEASREPFVSPEWVTQLAPADLAVAMLEVRGVGATRWTQRNPPNYVERSHALLGRTVDAGRVWDIVAAGRYLRGMLRGADGPEVNVHVAGHGPAGVLAAYAAIVDPSLSAVTCVAPPGSHLDAQAPQLLNVLRVGDIPDMLALIAPRPLRLLGTDGAAFTTTRDAYSAAQARDKLSIQP